ncbi:related to PSO2-DNA repair protein [Rhynchosporium agropyri]|uniref:Related to PSO2-DNA repair protein n=1 Tax=Rhynchosporium agropyri TaxID=914238 RepID=A0A1E1JUQ2_9HELO|nr:related to PSO2-DNA repair protein [Rhynchosporium agropyri]
MFRNPRENISIDPTTTNPLAPSTGRPPTPPNTTRSPHPPTTTTTMSHRSSTKPLTPRASSKSNAPTSGKQSTSTKKAFSTKPAGKPNASILSFFKKVDGPVQDDSIFLAHGSKIANLKSLARDLSPPELSDDDKDVHVEDLYGDGEERFNESGVAVKKRKVSGDGMMNGMGDDGDLVDKSGKGGLGGKNGCTPPPPEIAGGSRPKRMKRNGPFLSDSESDEDENENENEAVQLKAVKAAEEELEAMVLDQSDSMNEVVEPDTIDQKQIHENKPVVPSVQAVVPVKKVAKGRKKVDVTKAQAKWEALQPNTPPSDYKEASEGSVYGDSQAPKKKKKKKKAPRATEKTVIKREAFKNPKQVSAIEEAPSVPSLKKQTTSVDEWEKFEDFEEFPGEDDEFGNGEEAVERRWMAEQAKLDERDQDEDDYFGGFEEMDSEPQEEAMTASCPMCEASLAGLNPDDATKHVNGCLDGNPIPLPVMTPAPIKVEPTNLKTEPTESKFFPPGATRFARKAAIPRPGQANPFEMGATAAVPSSAFSKLMSGHAEDAAWANAAASEHKSRGKPAYERTCPFYKIMPGFFICVDAFRYGAVQGCNAYFLSHFHSDHYIGLSSTWSHGPIYCSKVTANLVKQQLRVDPKYVVPLDFEERFEVPGTQGVAITMIPANHCPGSSLFLFEKVIGKGKDPKVQRILHCGDFRACPAHLAHPLLMPDIVDSITGKTKQQKIDVCYLDTTYLNPKYSFPSQEEVIKACADMCVSLKKERAEETDAWEVVKRERAGTGMTKFVQNATIKSEDNSIAMSIAPTKDAKSRGRLLVVCGTYSIGKERICMGIARALDCKIWAPPGKMKICAALEDGELSSRLTSDPREAQIHMQMLMEIRPETLQDYLNGYKPHFSRIVGFRPSGWNYRPPISRFTASPSISTILHSPSWRSSFSMAELTPQRGSTREASCFGVPYSEHSSFRELTMFVCALRIEKVVPTVNVGSAPGRAKMKAWIERWMAERRKAGVIKLGEGGEGKGEVRW